jgi:hypothetical protein
METALFVKLQSQTQDTGITSNHIQDMKMIALLHNQRRPLPLITGKTNIVSIPICNNNNKK